MLVLKGVRRRLRRWVDARRPIVLLYHRVADLEHDPWKLAVTSAQFAEQIEALKRQRTVVPLTRLAEELARGRTPNRWAAVTFDDGYADVHSVARPILERHDCAATLFVTSGAIGSAAGFWWDRLARAIFSPRQLPQTNPPFTPAAGPSARESLHLGLWRMLRDLAAPEREERLAQIEVWAGVPVGGDPGDRALSEAELRSLAKSSVMDIGAHSVSHPSLPRLDRAQKAAEIAGSRRWCEEIVGHSIDSFAYPFGDLDEASRDEVARAGFAVACSTVPEPVRPSPDLLKLPRMTVGAWSGEEMARRLRAGSWRN